ncbi:MAG: DUF4349 domain-containing protein [Peptococcaceae bacterium]|nr:DUF4349 domain-containing protein [Peptococcaceae bacterium]
MNKDRITAMWEEDGDLMRLREFFSYIHQNDNLKNRIKEKTLEKIQDIQTLDSSNENVVNRLDASLTANKPNSKTSHLFNTIKNKVLNKKVFKTLSAAALVVLAVYVGSLGYFPGTGSMFKAKSTDLSGAQESGYRGAEIAAPAAPNIVVENEAMPEVFKSSSAKNSSLTFDGGSGGVHQDNNTLAADLIDPKIIYTFEASLKANDVSTAVKAIEERVKSIGGYISEARQNNIDEQVTAYLTIKVPVSEFENFKNILPEFGTISHQNLFTNDITLDYLDVETRLRSWEAQEKRYLEILQKANTVEEILRIEDSLANVRREIEVLKGQLRYWDNKVEYSEVRLNISSNQNTLNVNDPWRPLSFQSTLLAAKNALIKTISFLWNSLNYVVVFLGYALPVGILLVAAWFIYKYGFKRLRKKV